MTSYGDSRPRRRVSLRAPSPRRAPTLRPDWRETLKVGDVLRTPSKDFRVVRKVSRRKSGLIWGVTLAIRRCSWTHRAYTVLTRSDLRTMGYRKANVCVRLTSKMDRALDRCILLRDGKNGQSLTCCDVRAMP